MPHKKDLTTTSVDVPVQFIERRIYLIRGHKVMIDVDLAELYGVPTREINQRVQRNRKRFPEDFMFQLNKKEADVLRSQFVISSLHLFGLYFEVSLLSCRHASQEKPHNYRCRRLRSIHRAQDLFDSWPKSHD